MNARTAAGRAMPYAMRVAHMRAWFKRWRREFRVFDLPRRAPIQLGALAQAISWRVTEAHAAEFRASDALMAYARASNDERLQALVTAYVAASAEVEHHERAIQMLERAQLDYLRGLVWPGGEDQRQVLPSTCDRLHEWFRE
ncbi:MAG: hypothetical protein LWW96_14035 [Acidovorax sp.]|uniref:hypothetical protein n=1 Tax=Acidovorax sp. TaxID=1872122 RepID=UPI0025BF5832|nr:hypothetical protein [Acidovorax sp.]MCE1193262.1 hypothetical protein [Acidovorax sp.]